MSVEATIPSGTVEGRGQGHPGPSTFARPVSAWRSLAAAAVVLVASVAQFLLALELVEQGQRSASAAACAFAVGLVAIAMGARRSVAAGTGAGLAIAGAVVGGLVPLIYVSNQYSDAPSGTLVLFWTTVLPGALLLVGAALLRRSLRVLPVVPLALALVFTQAGVLGNWERPSSFSLLAKHVPEQLALAGNSVLFVAGLVALALLVRQAGWRASMLYFGYGSLVAGIGLIVSSGDPLGTLATVLSPLTLAFGIAFAAVVMVALYALAHGVGAAGGSGLALVPSAMSALIFVEAAHGAFGPEPILRGPVSWSTAAAVAVVIACVVTLGGRFTVVGDASPRKLLSVLRGGALAGTVLAGGGLVARALDVTVQGRYTDGSRFAADFAMRGWETVGGWIVLGAALAVLTLLLVPTSPVQRVLTGIGVAVTAMMWKVAGTTALHTWVTWIPAEVQQDYGTEYARIAFDPVTPWFQVAAVVIVVGTALIVVFEGVMRLRSTTVAVAEESEIE